VFDVFEGQIFVASMREAMPALLGVGDLLILVNRDMAIAIDREELKLRGLFNPATEKEFVSISGSAPAPDLVDVTLLTPDHREVDAAGFDEARHTIHRIRNATPIWASHSFLTWVGCTWRASMVRQS